VRATPAPSAVPRSACPSSVACRDCVPFLVFCSYSSTSIRELWSSGSSCCAEDVRDPSRDRVRFESDPLFALDQKPASRIAARVPRAWRHPPASAGYVAERAAGVERSSGGAGGLATSSFCTTLRPPFWTSGSAEKPVAPRVRLGVSRHTACTWGCPALPRSALTLRRSASPLRGAELQPCGLGTISTGQLAASCRRASPVLPRSRRATAPHRRDPITSRSTSVHSSLSLSAGRPRKTSA
jgi:hypothetical protein